MIDVSSKEGIGHKLRKVRERIFIETKKALLASAVVSTRRKDLHKQLGLKLDRSLANKQNKPREVSLSSGLFSQALGTLASPKAPQFLRGLPGEQVMSIEYKGEIGVDAGGLFNDTLTALCDELFSGELNLFLETPNTKAKSGRNLDTFVPNPSLNDPVSMNAFRAVGRLIALSVRSQQYNTFKLAPNVWDMLTSVDLTNDEEERLSLLDMIDSTSAGELRRIRDASEEEWEDMESFSCVNSAGESVTLVDTTEDRAVTYKEREHYFRLALGYRMSEFDKAVEAMRLGLHDLIPERVVRLFCGRDLEFFSCGESEFDIELLKEHTVYQGPGGWKDSKSVKFFWKCLESMSNEERSQVLRFIWGRKKLPRRDVWRKLRSRDSTFKLNYRGGGDEQLPVAHTCFFQLDWPRYTNLDRAKQALRVAVNYGMGAFNIR